MNAPYRKYKVIQIMTWVDDIPYQTPDDFIKHQCFPSHTTRYTTSSST